MPLRIPATSCFSKFTFLASTSHIIALLAIEDGHKITN